MSADFGEYLRRLRAGDERAAEELVRRYEPLIRRELRCRLRDRRLRRLFDSADVCQSVLASFFAGAAGGRYELDEPEGLRRLLLGMARNKLRVQARKHRARRRDHRRVAGGAEALAGAAGGPSPARAVEARELWQGLRSRLTEEERALADLRAEGRG
jgi:hypothetical protein